MTHKLNVSGLLKSQLKFDNFPIKYLDIGANRGQFFSEVKVAFPDVEACLIEPNPNCGKINRLGVEVHSCGISNKSGIMPLIVPKTKMNSKAGTFYKDINFALMNADDLIRIDVPVYTLDELFINRSFDLIKIDVQGSELDVIDGGTNTIQTAKYLIIECSLKEFNIGAPLADKIVKKLEELGFYIESILDRHYLGTDPNPIQIDILFTKDLKKHNSVEYQEYLGINL